MKKTKGMQRLWAFLLAFVLIATTVGNDGLTVLASENETEQSSEASSETHSAEASENTNSGGEDENSGEISQIRKRQQKVLRKALQNLQRNLQLKAHLPARKRNYPQKLLKRKVKQKRIQKVFLRKQIRIPNGKSISTQKAMSKFLRKMARKSPEHWKLKMENSCPSK